MMNWLTSTLAFLLLVVSLTALTSGIFLDSALKNFNLAQNAFTEKNNLFVEEEFKIFQSQLTMEQRQQFEQLNALTPEQKLLLGPQCLEEKNRAQPFCNPKFLSGEYSLDNAIRESISVQVKQTQFTSLEQMRNKLKTFADYNLMLIAIICGSLSLILFISFQEFFRGLQCFAGNVSWISLFSAISFKAMPSVINNLLLVTKQPGATDSMMLILKEIASDWLVPSMNGSFVVSIWLTVIGFVIWAVLKLFRNYDVQVN